MGWEHLLSGQQFLCTEYNDELIYKLKNDGMDLDIRHSGADEHLVELCHKNGIEINVWTVDDLESANRMIEYGVDYITTNIIE